MIIVLYALTALLYGGMALAVWQSHLRGVSTVFATADAAAPTVAPAHANRSPRAGVPVLLRLVLLAALVAHGVLLQITIFPPDSMVFGFAFALSAMLWLGAVIYWIESFFLPLDGLAMLILPLACIAALMPAAFGGVRVLPYAADFLFKIHFLIANLAYGLLTLAALHAILMLLLERRLHRHGSGKPGALSGWLDTLPPLLTLEKLLFRLIDAGFVVLTLALVSGIGFSEQLQGRAVTFDHKTVFALLSWVMFAVLCVGRRRYGWRGRTALRWVVAAFVALLLAYVGSRFVLEVLLHRAVV